MNKREVKLRILYDLLKGKGPLSLLGMIFTTLSIVVFIPLLLTLSSSKEPYEKYNFEEIIKNGTQKTAKVTGIIYIGNVTINGQHPEIIRYDYENNGQAVSDKFETLDLEKVADYKTGTEINVLVYQNQSMIKGLKPYSFPVFIFYLFPLPFFIVGVIFLLITLIPALRIFNLYKTGIIKEAKIISITSGSGIFPMRVVQQNFLVNYCYSNTYGSTIYGASKTPDFLILIKKRLVTQLRYLYLKQMKINRA